MTALLFAILGLAATLIFDTLPTRKAKKRIAVAIRQYTPSKTRRYLAHLAFDTFQFLFGSGLLDRKFWLRSAFLYVTLFSLSLLYVAILFPPTFRIIHSFTIFANYIDWLALISSFIIFFVFFTWANAQTLYFLDLLKDQPRPFRFFLIAYSDVIITASIAALGVALSMVAATIIVVNLQKIPVQLEFDFSRDLSSDGFVLEGSEVGTATTSYKSLAALTFDVEVELSRSEEYRKIQQYAFASALKSAEGSKFATISEDRQSIRYYNRRGRTIGRLNISQPRKWRESYYVSPKDLQGIDLEKLALESDESVELDLKAIRNQICNGMILQDFIEDQFVRAENLKVKGLVEACIQGSSAQISGDIRPLKHNINWGRLLSGKSKFVFGFFFQAPTDTLNMYIIDSPYRSVGRRTIAVDSLNRYDDYSTLEAVIGGAFLQGYHAEATASYDFVPKSAPYGTFLVSALITSLPSFLILVFVIALAPANLAVTSLQKLRRQLKVTQYPATFLSIFLLASYFALAGLVILLF